MAELKRKMGPSGGWHKNFMIGTLIYMAPELLRKQVRLLAIKTRQKWIIDPSSVQPYGFAADIYSLAITINELAERSVTILDMA